MKGENWCFNCLGNHRSTPCQSKNPLFTCCRKHHTRLWTWPPLAATNPNQHNQSSATTYHSILYPWHSCPNQYTSWSDNSLLKTAIATVSFDHTAWHWWRPFVVVSLGSDLCWFQGLLACLPLSQPLENGSTAIAWKFYQEQWELHLTWFQPLL